MYKPKSPKAVNFSPSPQSRRRLNCPKPNLNEQSVYLKEQRAAMSALMEQKLGRKTDIVRKTALKNIEIDSNSLVESLKLSDYENNNETPKFCWKPEICNMSNQNAYTVNPITNFFSFGSEQREKLLTQKKNKEVQQKQFSKLPKQTKKKIENIFLNGKHKFEVSTLESSNRYKKPNQPRVR